MQQQSVIVTYEGNDVNYRGTWYTRIIRKGSGGIKEWIRRSLLPNNPIIDSQYVIEGWQYVAIKI